MLSNNLAGGLSAEEEPRPSVGRASQDQKYTNGRGGANGNRQAYVTKVAYFPKAGRMAGRLHSLRKSRKANPPPTKEAAEKVQKADLSRTKVRSG